MTTNSFFAFLIQNHGFVRINKNCVEKRRFSKGSAVYLVTYTMKNRVITKIQSRIFAPESIVLKNNGKWAIKSRSRYNIKNLSKL